MQKFKKIRSKEAIKSFILEDIDYSEPKSAREVNAILQGENDGVPKISSSIRYNEKSVGRLFSHSPDFEIKIKGRPNKWGLVTEGVDIITSV